MPRHLPLPLVQAFVVCRELYQSLGTPGDLILIAPFSGITPPRYPAVVPLSVYAHLTDVHGTYAVGLKLVDADGNIAWLWPERLTIREDDPLRPSRVALHHMPVSFPAEGRYDLVITANDEEIAHHALWARTPPR